MWSRVILCAVQAQLLSYANHQPAMPVPHTPFGVLAEFSQGDTISSIDHAESSAESSLSLSAAHSGFGLLDSLDSTPANSLHLFDRNGKPAIPLCADVICCAMQC